MNDSNPNQLSLDIGTDQVDADIIESPREKEVFYRNPKTGDLISEIDIDHYSDTRPCSLNEAFTHYSVTPEDRVEDGQTLTEKKRPRRGKQPVATLLGERASMLMAAAYDYRESVKFNAKMNDLLIAGADSNEVDRATVDAMTHRNAGDSAIGGLNRVKDLEKAGFNSIQVRAGAREEVKEFRDLSTNPKRQTELLELVNILKSQKSRS